MSGTKTPPRVEFILSVEDDLVRMNELLNIPDVARYLNQVLPESMETTRSFWEQVLAGRFQAWSIWDKYTVVGVAGLSPGPAGTKLSHVTSFFLYLEPSSQGKGISDLAVRHLERAARDAGFLRLECEVAAPNEKAIRLYERHGFSREGVKRKAFRDGDRFCDIVVMGKLIGEDTRPGEE